MRILFLGDIVGPSGCDAIKKNLKNIINDEKIDFVIVNGENAATEGVGITENITNEILSCNVDVITTGNHVWDQKETYEYIKKEDRLLRPFNFTKDTPGKGFNIYNSKYYELKYYEFLYLIMIRHELPLILEQVNPQNSL